MRTKLPARGQVVPAKSVSASVIDDRLKHKDGPRGAKDGEWLARKHSKEGSHNQPRDKRLHACHVLPRGITKETSEGNDWSQTGKVDENVGGDTLKGHGILEIGEIPRLLSFDVIDQATKQPSSSCQS